MIPRLYPDFDLTLHDLRRALPAVAFFAGFLWDALTLGRTVTSMDLWILAAYLAGAAGILWFLGRRQALEAGSGSIRPSVTATEAVPAEKESGSDAAAPTLPHGGGWRSRVRVGARQGAFQAPPSPPTPLPTGEGSQCPTLAAISGTPPPPWWQASGPYLLLQFFFGGLFSALFIFYFKSSSHVLAYVWALVLGAMLVANEFLEDRYRRFTLTWALFGLCAMLLLNFVLPHIVGSVAGFWFFLSTLLGAGLAQGLHMKTPGRPGRTWPVWAIAAGLFLAYALDVIPPVPLVKRDLAVGHDLVRAEGLYRLQLEKTPWWVFWRRVEREVHLAPGERLYCVSAVFAPRGLDTRLYHRWQRYEDGRGWVTWSRVGFGLSGGREGGYRGYTWKQNLAPGDWRVAVETENGRTVAVHRFDIAAEPRAADAPMLSRDIH